MLAPSSRLSNPDSSTSGRCSAAHRSDLSGAWSSLSRLVQPLHVRRLRQTEFRQLLFCGLSCMPIFCSKLGFQKPFDYLVGCFYLSVRLRVSRRAILQLYPEVLAKVHEVMVIKLPAIICYQGIRDAVTTDQVSPYEVSCLFLCDPAEDYLYPLREIVYYYHCMC